MAAESGVGADGLRQQLMAAGVNPVSLEEQIRADIAWGRLMSGLFGNAHPDFRQPGRRPAEPYARGFENHAVPRR
jgi:hypothetical protein